MRGPVFRPAPDSVPIILRLRSNAPCIGQRTHTGHRSAFRRLLAYSLLDSAVNERIALRNSHVEQVNIFFNLFGL